MNKKEFLNEEQYQKINKKVNLFGKIMLIFGGLSFLVCTILLFGNLIDFEVRGLISILWVFSFALAGFGLMFYIKAHSRELSAYLVQQQMPIAKESIEKMAPTAGVAAEEIAKGIKKGLSEEE